ncbi:MAG: hypothetical protein R3D26_07585 [Cyanobacteriota/Melainabacteria group bacterium]
MIESDLESELELELEPESEPESESAAEQVDLAKLFSEDKLALWTATKPQRKERKQLKAISASGLNALIDFKRTATDQSEQTELKEIDDSVEGHLPHLRI